MNLPRIALFGGPWRMSGICLDALIERGHQVLLITPPVKPSARIRRIFRRSLPQIEQAARRAGADVVRYGRAEACETALRRFCPDLICIATFPRLIPARIMALAPGGAINVHPSLLPRHRGNQPLFWTYFHDDRFTGVTVHRATQRFDAGPVIAQDQIPLPRAFPQKQLAEQILARCGPLLLRAIDAVGAGAPEWPQDEAEATSAPNINRESFRTPFQDWDVERVWHFLSGVASIYREPIIDDRGKAVSYQSVASFERGPAGPPGLAVRKPGGWTLHCRGGTISLLA